MYLGGVLNIVIILAVLQGLGPPHAYGTLPSRAEAIVYNAISRTLWAVGIAWIVFACEVGYGGGLKVTHPFMIRKSNDDKDLYCHLAFWRYQQEG